MKNVIINSLYFSRYSFPPILFIIAVDVDLDGAGEHPAAMQHNTAHNLSSCNFLLIIFATVIIKFFMKLNYFTVLRFCNQIR
jgi:hypothetical protein